MTFIPFNKPKLIYFSWLIDENIPIFLLYEPIIVKTLSEFFEVIVIKGDCDYKEVCDTYKPDISLFTSGISLVSARRPDIKNTSAYPDIPKIGLLRSDTFCPCRAVFLSDMEYWGITTFFTFHTSTGEYTPEILDNLFYFPVFVDTDLFYDYGEKKTIPVLFIGTRSKIYPWRHNIKNIVADLYTSLIYRHWGYSEKGAKRMLFGEDYAKLLASSWFVPTCGTMSKYIISRQLEAPAVKSCLITEKTPVVETYGFVDMENCILTDGSDVVDKIEYLFYENRDELLKIIEAGHTLVHTRHTYRQRDQILQWFNLHKNLKLGQRIVQTGLLEPFLAVDEKSNMKNFHLFSNGLDRELLKQGDLKLLTGNYEEAESLYNKCLEYCSYMAEPKLRIGICNLYIGKPQKAIKWIYEPIQRELEDYRALDVDPVEWAYYIISWLCLGRLDEARKHSDRFPSLSHIELNRTRILVRLLQNSNYRFDMNSVEAPGTRHSIHQLRKLSFGEWIKEICFMFRACKQYDFLELLDNIIKKLSLNIDISSEISVGYNEIIDKLITSGDLAKARLYIESVVAKQPDNRELMNLKAEIKYKSGQIEEAKKILADIIEKWPDDTRALNNLGVIFWKENNIEKALTCFMKVLKINRDDRTTVLNLCEILISLNKYKEAKNLYSSYTERHREDREITALLSKLEDKISEEGQKHDSRILNREKPLRTMVKNIVISGTNFWNPGDDFVRDGVIAILKRLFTGYRLNFLFYNFNQDFFPQSKFTGIANMLAKGDLDKYKQFVDFIVIAGLSAGREIKDMYNWIIENNLHDRVYMIGAGYENPYVDRYIYEEPEATIFKHARIITGRTKKTPRFIPDLKLPYHHINCPAILSVKYVKKIPSHKKIEKIGFSIQLPHEIGVSNHCCAEKMYRLSVDILVELSRTYPVHIIAHHKSEYFHFLNLFKGNIPVLFSSYYQDLFDIYPDYDLFITTRLHSSLFANGHGIPGIILNDTDRHTHCLEGFPHSVWVDNKEKFYREFDKICNSNLYDIAMESENFKNNLMKQYIEILSKPFGLDVQTIERKPLEKVIICNEVLEKTCLENELNDDFTDNGLWTPQTFMLQEINRWVRKTDFNARYALSIDNNPTLDPVILKKWPEINIVRAVYPEYDVQNLSHLKDNTFDLVYSHQVIEHIPKPWNAAKEIVRVLKQGGIGLHTTCAFNPRHGLPEFNDYYRFLPDGLAELFEGVKIIIKGGWGNRNALIHNLSVDDGHGLLGGRRFDKVIGQENDNLYPWHTWVIFMKI